MAEALTESQLADYERDGCICPIAVLSPAEALRFREALERQEACMGGKLKRIDNSHLFFQWAFELATHPAILDVMESLLGPDLFVHSTRVFYKHAHDPAYVSWHQDGVYSNLNSKPAPSAWIALSPSTVENGCLRVVPGSHKNGKLPHIETFAEDNLLNHGEEITAKVEEATVRELVLEPGQMSIHHVNLVHGSNPNQSGTSRIGFAVSYITPSVYRSRLPVVRVRGNSSNHEFELVSGPAEMSMAGAIRAHEAFMERGGFRKARVSRA